MNDFAVRQRAFFATLPDTIDAFLVLTGDPWGSEYLPEHWALRAYLTGFTGSAGTLLLKRNASAVLWTDSRYTIAARKCCEALGMCFVEHRTEMALETAQEVENLRVGIDPETLSQASLERLRLALENVGASLVILPDALRKGWLENRPKDVAAPLFRIDPPEATSERLTQLRDALSLPNDTAYLFGPEETAWATHLRAFDVTCNTTPHVRLWVPQTGSVRLLVEKNRVSPEVKDALCREGVLVSDWSEVPIGKLFADPENLCAALWEKLTARGFTLTAQSSPASHLLTVKTSAEQDGMRRALLLDAQAQAECYAWLEESLAKGEKLSEWDVAQQLRAERAKASVYLCESFTPIVAVGANAALPHYETTKDGATSITGDTLLLIDSGAHYRFGTTDTTRMSAIGRPSPAQLAASTHVLQGMLALARAKWPKETPASALDAIARAPLWQAGLDFGHGTGHGIGFAQSVHEGPLRISPRWHGTLPVGAILSDEPGVYIAGHFGVRWENTLLVLPDEEHEGFLRFETLTYTPLDRRAFDATLLSDEERKQIDEYHARARSALLKVPLSKRARAWVLQVTEPLCKEK